MMSRETGMQEGQENEAPVPGQPNDDLVSEILQNLNYGRRHISRWRVEARESYDFFAGVQWDDEDAQTLADQNRPVVTFNRIARTINAVSGLEVQNRQEVKYFPRRNDNYGNTPLSKPMFSEVLTAASKWAREQCDAEDEESEAFQDSLICGLGWSETRMDYEDNPEGMIIEDRVDPLEMLHDPSAKKKNLADAKWMARIKQIPRKEFNKMWPDADIQTPNSFWTDYEAMPHDADDAWKYENDQSDKLSKTNTVSVVQYQYYELVKLYKMLDPETGKIIEIPEERFKAMQGMLDTMHVKYVSYSKRVYRQCFLAGRTFLEESDLGCNHFTFKCITGLRDRNRGLWFGLVAMMKDPQRWANKWLSQVQHIVNTNAKNTVFAERGAFANRRKAEEDLAKPGAIIDLNDGGLQKILQKDMSSYPDGVDKLLQYALQSINDVTGVSLELIGMAERDQPYVLEQTRKQAGITILATFFDSLRRYRKQQGRVLAYFIREYISDGRLIRIVGDQGAQYIPLIKDEMAVEYDIVVDDAPTSPNVKERSFMVLNQLVPMCLQSGIPIPPDILDYAPLPQDLIQKWKQLITEGANNPKKQELEQLQRMLAMLDLQQKQADVQETQSKTTVNYAKAEQAHAIGQDESAQAMQKMGMQNNEFQMKQEAMLKEQARKDLEVMLNHRRKLLETELNAEIKSKQVSSASQSQTMQ
jgi:hypothetical protein